MSDERLLGEHGARLNALEEDLQEIKADVKQVLQQMAQAQGGWKTMMIMGGFSAAIGGLIAKVWPFK